jgi:CheY-like chemotaxis protein
MLILDEDTGKRPAVTTPAKPLVLCIDDERIGLRVRKLLLERAGYEVLTAPDGPTGLACFEDQPIDAVLLDFSMPGMDGGEVAARMRRSKPKVPILLLSAYVGLPAEIDGLVDGYLTKADDADTLLARLRSLLYSEPAVRGPA